ncbi:MAG: hypothetical protein KGN79_11145 [Acidobacteriota bacterium]|nr:hypothetical protein [Acidobacteriota bacterium]
MRKSLEAISVVVLGYLVWITWSALAGPNRLTGPVPIHYDAAGHVTAWGAPTGLMLLPVVAVMLYLGMTVVSRFPSSFNFPVRVLPSVRSAVEDITLDMIAWVKLELTLLFATLQSAMIAGARGSGPGLPPLLMPAFLVVIFGTVGWHFAAVLRVARRQLIKVRTEREGDNAGNGSAGA